MNITEDNYVILAAKAYQPACLSQEDFIKDLRSLDQIKAAITRYHKSFDSSCLRILINKFIIASNNFGPVEAMQFAMFTVRTKPQYIVVLKTLFVFLEIFPESLHVTDELTIDHKFETDDKLLIELQKIAKIK